MKILLDESLPIKLAPLIIGHEIHTIRSLGWLGRKNGLLLSSMVDEQFDILVTADASIPYQRSLKKYPIAVVVLHAKRTSLERLTLLVPALLVILPTVKPSSVIEVNEPDDNPPAES